MLEGGSKWPKYRKYKFKNNHIYESQPDHRTKLFAISYLFGWIRIQRKFGRKAKSIPLLKFQIFITIKRGFLGRGNVIAPFFGHNAVINRLLPTPFHPLRLSSIGCRLHIAPYPSASWKLFHFQLERDTTRRKIYFRVGTRPPIPFPKVCQPVMFVISDDRVGYAT